MRSGDDEVYGNDRLGKGWRRKKNVVVKEEIMCKDFRKRMLEYLTPSKSGTIEIKEKYGEREIMLS